jgi:hypothetical protein
MRSSLPGIATYDWRSTGKPIDPGELRRGLETLLSQAGLEAAINWELYYTADMMWWLQQFRVEAEEILDLIDTKT